MSLMAKQLFHLGKGSKNFLKINMQLQLINGQFSKEDALDLITQMIQVKIKYHEQKIESSHTEEDIKMRESRIMQLQKDVAELKKNIQKRHLAISSQIKID